MKATLDQRAAASRAPGETQGFLVLDLQVDPRNAISYKRGLMKFSGFIFLLALFISPTGPQSLATASEGHSLVTHEDYIPQTTDLGAAIGLAFNTSNYILADFFGGFQITSCGFHCFQYFDFSARAAAQNGQSHYMSIIGWRLQRYFDGSSWGPYLRPFIGNNHYIYTGTVEDSGLFGAALGANYFLHPAADARFEIGHAFGPIPFTMATIGLVIKLRNL